MMISERLNIEMACKI